MNLFSGIALTDITITGGTATIAASNTDLAAKLATFKGAPTAANRATARVGLDASIMAMAREMKQHAANDDTLAVFGSFDAARDYLSATFLKKTYDTGTAGTGMSSTNVQAMIDLSNDLQSLVQANVIPQNALRLIGQ